MYFSYARKDDSSRNWLVHVEHMTVKLFSTYKLEYLFFFCIFFFFPVRSLSSESF